MDYPAIQTLHITTGYKTAKHTVQITRDLSENLYAGELTCLLGPNGAGKTTLLKTLSGFLPPLSGDIILEGKKLYSFKEPERARMLSVVLTDRLAVSNMTVRQLVELGRSPYTGFFGRPSEKDFEIVEEAIAQVKIDYLADRTVATLSDGERQKALIAKALAQETPVIFLDEPTAFLDYPGKAEILLLLRKLAREKQKTIFVSTHDLELALQIADRLWLLDKTKGVRTGSPEKLSDEGEIGNYFNRDGLIYDKEARLFRVCG